MQSLDLSTAEGKILADIRRYIDEVQYITRSPVETVEDGVRTLVVLRKNSYEDLNQIQHEYAALCAVRWLIAQLRVPEGVTWQWNPRQTGDATEPDIRAVLEGNPSGRPRHTIAVLRERLEEVALEPVAVVVEGARKNWTIRKISATRLANKIAVGDIAAWKKFMRECKAEQKKGTARPEVQMVVMPGRTERGKRKSSIK